MLPAEHVVMRWILERCCYKYILITNCFSRNSWCIGLCPFSPIPYSGLSAIQASHRIFYRTIARPREIGTVHADIVRALVSSEVCYVREVREAIASQPSVKESDGGATGIGELLPREERVQFHAQTVVGPGTRQTAISTGGRNPLFVIGVEERLGASIGPEYRGLADVLSTMRVVVRYHEEASGVWHAMFERLIAASCRPLQTDVPTAASL